MGGPFEFPLAGVEKQSKSLHRKTNHSVCGRIRECPPTGMNKYRVCIEAQTSEGDRASLELSA